MIVSRWTCFLILSLTISLSCCDRIFPGDVSDHGGNPHARAQHSTRSHRPARRQVGQRSTGRAQTPCCGTELARLALPNNQHIRLSIPHAETEMPNNAPGVPMRQQDLNEAAEMATIHKERVRQIESTLKARGLYAKKGSVAYRHHRFHGTSMTTNKLSHDGQMAQNASAYLAYKFGTTGHRLHAGKYSFRNTRIGGHCPSQIKCRPSKYRTMDGSCNNPNNPEWGMANGPYNRLLIADYCDGVGSPRCGHYCTLPGARECSAAISQAKSTLNPYITSLCQSYGQFTDHDLTNAASTQTAEGDALDCCQDAAIHHPACYKIDVSPNDPFYKQFNLTCMSFVRSAPVVRPYCEVGAREQMNQVTSYIDLSQVYGNDKNTSDSLRTFQGGKFKTILINGAQHMPQTRDGCEIPATSQAQCFVSGDSRVNEQVPMTVINRMFFLFHNYCCDILHQLNPTWPDEILFQECRRIAIGVKQHITYTELLPVLLGKSTCDTFGLTVSSSAIPSSCYNPNINPTILNEWAASAYRLHTMITPWFDLVDNYGKKLGQVDTSDTFSDPSLMYAPDGSSNLINGMCQQQVELFDNQLTNQMTEMLFRPKNASFGGDIMSLNVQRGRDHGLPPWNRMRVACGLEPMRTWYDLQKVMSPEAAMKLEQVYSKTGCSPDDIDMYLGGISETPMSGAIVGPTFACVNAEQFRRLKCGDYFWYENLGYKTSFSRDQIFQIKKMSLAALFCMFGDNVGYMQRFPMIQYLPDWNKKMTCKEILAQSNIDFNWWRNEPIYP